MLGDDSEARLARTAVKWLQKNFNFNVLTMNPEKKDYGHHNLPIERFGHAIEYLKSMGNIKFALARASTTAMLSLIAAPYYPEFTFALAFTPCAFVMEGFYLGNRDGIQYPEECKKSRIDIEKQVRLNILEWMSE